MIGRNGGDESNILYIFGIRKINVFLGSPNFQLNNYYVVIFNISTVFCLTFSA